jgi:DNA-binding transcriptional LysR family regulator
MKLHADTSISEIAAFAAVAQTGSFTRAAENLGTSKSNVGKAVQRLEARLGAKLFQRTTRAVRLTEDGEIYLAAAQAALNGLNDAELALAARRAEPIGRVKVDLPSGLGRLLLPTWPKLRVRYPKVTLELGFSDRMSDAVGEGWDIVVRIGALPDDSEMTVRKLCDLRLGLYAAPEYVQSHKPIAAVPDLSTHDAVIFRGPTGRLRPWSVLDAGQIRDISPDPVLVTNDGQGLLDATLCGLGISQILDKVAHPYVASGRLRAVLPESNTPGPAVHALIPLGSRMPAKTRAVLDHIADVLRAS